MKEETAREWAIKAWEQDMWFEGTITGGTAPVKNMISCNVEGNIVEISYDYPETCGLSDCRYHVVDPHKIRTDRIELAEGKILMNGKEFPGELAMDDPGLKEEAEAFLQKYAEAIKAETGHISRSDLSEFLGQIIDIFEDFLEEKGISIENGERNERDDPESAAIIYGSDYGQLQSAIEETLIGWELVEQEVAS